MMSQAKTLHPSSGLQAISAVIHFVGVSILAHFLSRRLEVEDLLSLRGWTQLTWARLLIVLVFIDSWLFLLTGGILLFGAGLETSEAACTSAIWLWIIFYTSSKAFIYLFLIEKVHVLWTPLAGAYRNKSPVYMICMVTMFGYVVITILLFVGRIANIQQDGACVIGLSKLATIPLVVYDLITNVLLTVLFLWPLARSNIVNPVVKRVAIRTLLASTVALVTSAAHMLILTLLHGHELGWVCLGSCGADVFINALALFWVTGGSGSSATRPSMSMFAKELPAALPVTGAGPAYSTRRGSAVLSMQSRPPQFPTPAGSDASPAQLSDEKIGGYHAKPAGVKGDAKPRALADAGQSPVTFLPVRWSMISQEAKDDREAASGHRGSLGRLFAISRAQDALHTERSLEVSVTRESETRSDSDSSRCTSAPHLYPVADDRRGL